eukprot:scaffold11206_cov117-Isochrysis_galbana.AAC.13
MPPNNRCPMSEGCIQASPPYLIWHMRGGLGALLRRRQKFQISGVTDERCCRQCAAQLGTRPKRDAR